MGKGVYNRKKERKKENKKRKKNQLRKTII